jgi:rSAM/selenodomain-associated transferase 2
MKIGGGLSRMISVIIPTYNEAGYLPATLDSVAESKTIQEVIVVDAGSADGTGDLARRRASFVVFSARRQRASRMNLGARHAHGGALLFLHADTRLPTSALDQIGSALLNDRIVGGGFARRYDSTSWFLQTTCLLAGLRARMTGWFLGDQAIFVRRETFEKLGGFRDLELFEDLDFSMRMAQTGRVVTLFPSVISSSRRFMERGPVLTTLLDVWLTCRYLTGTDPNALAGALRASVARKARVGPSRGYAQGTPK